MEVLRWQSHLHPVLAAAMILILAVWLIVLFGRQRRSHSLKQTLLLLFPKILIVLLIILAYFDPARSVVKRPNRDKKIMVLVDTSSSMDCRDESKASRFERAEELAQNLAEELRTFIDFENLDFDVEVHGTKNSKQTTEQIKGTDLGKCLLTTADKTDNTNYDSIVLLTDGGDEIIQTPKLPQVPLYIIGIGSSPDLWNDLAVTEVTSPQLVEQGSNFEVSTDILARFASRDFATKVSVAQVKLEEKLQDRWQVRGSEFVRFDNPRARAKFSLQAPAEAGIKEYRVDVQNFDGELSNLNNVRNFSVEVRKETLHVLFFTQELGWDFSTIRKMLANDPSVELTALFRISEQRFIVQGSRQKGDEQLEAGFPSSKEVLDLYKCIIVGSFGESRWQQNQLNALLQYVRDGGAVVFLGGENSFGRGGYDQTIIEPLFPWRISKTQSKFQIGRFDVSVPASALSNSIIEETARIVSKSESVSVESLNVEGPLKEGAVTLLEASAAGRYVPLVSIQRYGRGQTMAIATNTLWKWTRVSDELKEAYGYFWQQAVKNMTSWEEGRRFLAIKWDRQQYNPGEKASATIRVAGRHDPDKLRLAAEMEVEGKTTPVAVEPVMGQGNTFRAEINLAGSARYRFELQAFLGEQMLESYEKTIAVGTRLNEGANLEVDHAFLNNLTAQAGGGYFREAEFENLIGTLRSRILNRVVSMEIPLIEDKCIYVLILIGILVLEWLIRRRMNLL